MVVFSWLPTSTGENEVQVQCEGGLPRPGPSQGVGSAPSTALPNEPDHRLKWSRARLPKISSFGTRIILRNSRLKRSAENSVREITL